MVAGKPERAKRMKMARAGAGLNQLELAEAVSLKVGTEVSRNMVQRWEKASRDPEVSMLVAIAEVCDVSLAWLTAEPALAGDRANPGQLRSKRSLHRPPRSGHLSLSPAS
jgi:transcriptional regulator with XRE-family HTH domain